MSLLSLSNSTDAFIAFASQLVLTLAFVLMSGCVLTLLAAVADRRLARTQTDSGTRRTILLATSLMTALLLPVGLAVIRSIWWMSRRIHELRERAGDELVLSAGTDRLCEAAARLHVAELAVPGGVRSDQLAQSALDGRKPSQLKSRIQRILNGPGDFEVRVKHSQSSVGLAATALLFVIALFPLDGTDWRTIDVQAAQPTTTENQTAPPAADTAAADTPAVTSAEPKPFAEQLAKKVTIESVELPLISALDRFEKLSEIPLTVSLSEWILRGVDSQILVTLVARDETFETVLDRLTQQANLTFEVEQSGLRIPAKTPALEFRIVPGLPDSADRIRVPEAYSQRHYRDGTAAGPGSSTDRGFAWFPIGDAGGEVNVPVSAATGKRSIALLCDIPSQLMTAGDSFSVKEVSFQREGPGGPQLLLTLDEPGGRKMRQLTQACLNQKLAVLIHGVVLAAPTVREPVGSQLALSGKFSAVEWKQIEASLRSAMPRPEAEFDAEKLDPKKPEPEKPEPRIRPRRPR